MKKKFVFALSVGLLMSVMFCGCKSKKDIPQKPEIRPPAEVAVLNLLPWENNPAIKDDNTMSFFNEFEISVAGSIPNFAYQINNGVLEKIDKSQTFAFKIPKNTPGILAEKGVVRNSNGDVIAIKVSFFEGEEVDCYVVFSKKKGGKQYFLENKAIVVFEEKEYKVPPSFDSEKTGRLCRVLYDEDETDNSTRIENVATGKIIPGIQELP